MHNLNKYEKYTNLNYPISPPKPLRTSRSPVWPVSILDPMQFPTDVSRSCLINLYPLRLTMFARSCLQIYQINGILEKLNVQVMSLN